uniref:Rabaptin, RAB GTPase binding effector protein 1 n=1 Tax=Erpetoichthys calabaricus TaxID=27687 RepID=A0A8C4S5M1_ERPCA
RHQPGIELKVLHQRVLDLEQEKAEYLRVKQHQEQEFNQRRAKFKELYLSKEGELKKQGVALQASQDEFMKLQKLLSDANAEMETIKAVATVSENTKQEAIDQVKRQWQEEVASLQAIMKEAARDYELQFQQERSQWSQYREAVEREMAELRRQLKEGQEEENLENEMKKAQEDAEKLRSVVMPMEQEITALKSRLTEAEDRVKELEAAKVTELNHVLEAEKSCRTDLEMYVAVLNTQKSVLQEDAEKLRKELHEVCHLLEQERQQHNQLKHTWQRANDQFLESQRLLMRDMQRIESVLSSEQLRQVEEMKKRDQEEDEQQKIKAKKNEEDEVEGEESIGPVHANHSFHSSLHSLDTDVLISTGEECADKEDGSTSDLFKDGLRRAQSTDSLGTSGGGPQQKSLGYNNKAKSAGNLDESDFGPLVGADCSGGDNFDTASLGSFQLSSGCFLLTKDQEKAIKAMTPEQEETASLLSSISQAPDNAYLPPLGYRLVSESEWNLLQQEVILKFRSHYICFLNTKMVNMVFGKGLIRKLSQANDKIFKWQLKYLLQQLITFFSLQISTLMQKVQESETLLSSIQQAFSQAKRNAQEQMAVLMQSREQVAEELSRLQRENESLQGKHRLHIALQQQENFLMPDTVEMQALVLRYREDIVCVRTASDHVEEKLKAEILFLKEQIQAEQCLKENLEETLQLEIESCKEEIGEMAAVINIQLVSRLTEKTQHLENLQTLRSNLEEQLKKETTARTNFENQVYEEKDKAQRLQTELDVSEQVQRDFVKLSQTLQVQLERIRQADSLDQIRVILNETNLTDINQLPET